MRSEDKNGKVRLLSQEREDEKGAGTMKVHRSKWMSWLLMISMVVTLLQPALQAHAAEDSVKWVT
ncbi:hypothetical protein Elgi_15610 [Paenibacillus elgii]|nr:hypothetical protein Elgi_15610 [Paenibacillus elgii]